MADDDLDDHTDYVTMLRRHPGSDQWLVAVMRWERPQDSFVMRECCAVPSYHGAVHLASQWSKEKHLEVVYHGKRKRG